MRKKTEDASLAAALREKIANAGGWISFADFMAAALYHPRLGYYAAGRARFDGGGDFVTAPHTSPLFARCIAAQIKQILSATGGGVLELGAGDGALAKGILSDLIESGAPPASYFILEPSAALRRRQKARFAGDGKKRDEVKPRWIARLPRAFRGVVIANEVLDAVPCIVAHKRGGEWHERGVACKPDGGFVWQDAKQPSADINRRLGRFDLPDGCISEINPQMEALLRTLAILLERGAILCWDYGFAAAEYYHPQRARGTLMCHFQNRAHDNPFFAIGAQDITAHIDFSAAAEAAADGGAQLLGYASQANFLINCGILKMLEEENAPTAAAQAKLNAGVHKLLAPHEMGELFKVIAFGKNYKPPLIGFSQGGREHRL